MCDHSADNVTIVEMSTAIVAADCCGDCCLCGHTCWCVASCDRRGAHDGMSPAVVVLWSRWPLLRCTWWGDFSGAGGCGTWGIAGCFVVTAAALCPRGMPTWAMSFNGSIAILGFYNLMKESPSAKLLASGAAEEGFVLRRTS